MRRHRLSRKASKRSWQKGKKTRRENYIVAGLRGGITL